MRPSQTVAGAQKSARRGADGHDVRAVVGDACAIDRYLDSVSIAERSAALEEPMVTT